MTNTITDAKRYIEMTTPSQATIIIQELLKIIERDKSTHLPYPNRK